MLQGGEIQMKAHGDKFSSAERAAIADLYPPKLQISYSLILWDANSCAGST